MSDRPVPETGNKAHANATADESAWLRLALRAIEGPADSGPFIEAYRDAGGGYEGLQAVATFALESVGRELASARPASDGQGSDQSPGPEPSTESWRSNQSENSRVVGEREEQLREAAYAVMDELVKLYGYVPNPAIVHGRIVAEAALASSPSPPDREVVGNLLQSAGEDLHDLSRLLEDGTQALALTECALASVDKAVAALFGRGDES